MRTPGTNPPRKRLATDTSVITAKITMITDGGMMGPMIAEVAVTAAAKAGSKPSRFISSISMIPRPAASACAVPDMPAKIIDPSTFTWARPPRTWPTAARAKS
jgi:hypothetical protein